MDHMLFVQTPSKCCYRCCQYSYVIQKYCIIFSMLMMCLIQVSVGKEVVVVARRMVDQGEHITDCYGFHYTGLEQSERRRRILRW